jgi:hypothetical protein
MSDIEKLERELETAKFIYNEIILRTANKTFEEVRCRVKAYYDTLNGQLTALLKEKSEPNG